ncbi:MAG: M20/M25/M40 family metallo-hydrolase [Pseudomonadota bacterium]
MSLEAVLTHIDDDLDQALNRLKAFLQIKSISTDPDFAAECEKAADWLVADLRSIGFDARKDAVPGHPMVVAPSTGGHGPHVKFYGHYDVQPVDPIELWDKDPFDPQIEDTPKGKVIRGRGTSDDKGQLMTFVEACRAWKTVTGSLPLPVSLFFEGEEESGSPSLIPYMNAHKDQLGSDVVLICDTGMVTPETPSIVTMLRGMVSEEVTITGPSIDLHSGFFGGAAINPIRVLSDALAALYDKSGAVTLPGFYDGVPELSETIAAQWSDLPFDADGFLNAVGLSKLAGEDNRSLLELTWSRPTAEINGIWGGYTGTGFKTVIPSKASAKVSFRLVGTQNPDQVRDAFRNHIRAHLPQDCSAEFAEFSNGAAASFDVSHPAFETARQALTEEWGVPAAFVGCGGSIPIAGHFKDIIGSEPMLIGFGMDDDAIHSPNEKYDLRSFHKGIRSWARILGALS